MVYFVHKKQKRRINSHFLQNVKWRNLVIFIVFVSVFISGLYIWYNSWSNSVTSPSEKTTLAFTILPAGGGKGDKLVSNPLIPSTTFNRGGSIQGNDSIIFGPWEKTTKIIEIIVHPIIDVPQDSTINVTLHFKDTLIPIGSFTAKGDPEYDLVTFVGWNFKFTWAHFDVPLESELLILRGETGTIEIASQDTQNIAINSDTYIWFDVLQSEYNSIPSWSEIVVTNPLSIGIILLILPFLFSSGIFYKTRSEIQKEDTLNVLKEIRDNLKR